MTSSRYCCTLWVWLRTPFATRLVWLLTSSWNCSWMQFLQWTATTLDRTRMVTRTLGQFWLKSHPPIPNTCRTDRVTTLCNHCTRIPWTLPRTPFVKRTTWNCQPSGICHSWTQQLRWWTWKCRGIYLRTWLRTGRGMWRSWTGLGWFPYILARLRCPWSSAWMKSTRSAWIRSAGSSPTWTVRPNPWSVLSFHLALVCSSRCWTRFWTLPHHSVP